MKSYVARAVFCALILGSTTLLFAEGKLDVTMETDKKVYRAGDEIKLVFTVRNNSPDDISNTDGIKFEDFLKVLDLTGKELERTNVPQRTTREYQPAIVAPGCSFTALVNLRALFAGLASPGSYSVHWQHPTHGGPLNVPFEVFAITEQTTATIQTNFGNIVIGFFPDVAPRHVENFINLAKKGFYDGLTFHRIVKGFVMQGGCPNGDGTGNPGYTIKAEFNPRKHLEGTVAMARGRAPDSAGSQFYICFRPLPQLDNNYTVFGQVIEGMDVVKRIEAECATADGQKPLKRVDIIKVTINEPAKKPETPEEKPGEAEQKPATPEEKPGEAEQKPETPE